MELPAGKLVADRIRYFRNLLRLSQAFVAERLGMERTTYTKMERGTWEFSAGHLRALGNLLRVPVEEFFRPLRVDESKLRDVSGAARYRLNPGDFREWDSDGAMAIDRSARELIAWAKDEANEKELGQRRKVAAETYG